MSTSRSMSSMSTFLPGVARCLFAALAVIAADQSLYGQSLTVLTAPDGDIAHITAISNSGQYITGTVDGAGYVYSNGVMTFLGDLKGAPLNPVAVNNLGQVTGNASSGSAFFYSVGVVTSLGSLGGVYATAAAINNLGQVVGSSATAAGANEPFLYSNGAMTNLDPSVLNSFAPAAINDSGKIAGVGAFVNDNVYRALVFYLNGTAYPVAPIYPSGYLSMNSSGDVATVSNLLQATVYSGGTIESYGAIDDPGRPDDRPAGTDLTGVVTTDLGAFNDLNIPIPPLWRSAARDINDEGQVVGWAAGSYATPEQIDAANYFHTYINDTGISPFIYSNGVMTNLDREFADLLGNGSSPGFVSFGGPDAISDNGIIIGQGLYDDGGGIVKTYGVSYILDTGGRFSVPDSTNVAALLTGVFLMFALCRCRLSR